MIGKAFLSLSRRSLQDRRGVSSVEFVLIVPILAAMIFAIIDIGNALHTRFRLGAAVAAGGNYALSRAAEIGTASATSVSSDVARLVSNTTANAYSRATIVVNNGPTAVAEGTSPSVSGGNNPESTNALCYCPGGIDNWGAPRNCGSICPSGGLAGRFVQITARRTFTPIVTTFGIADDGYVTVSALVQAE